MCCVILFSIKISTDKSIIETDCPFVVMEGKTDNISKASIAASAEKNR